MEQALPLSLLLYPLPSLLLFQKNIELKTSKISLRVQQDWYFISYNYKGYKDSMLPRASFKFPRQYCHFPQTVPTDQCWNYIPVPLRVHDFYRKQHRQGYKQAAKIKK